LGIDSGTFRCQDAQVSQYSLADLAHLADVTPRTVRFYIATGLLRSPEGAGPKARYDDGHLSRLRLIKRLQKDHLPLAEIRARLSAVSDEDAALLVSEQPEPHGTAADYISALLQERGVARRSRQRPLPTPAQERWNVPLPGSWPYLPPVGPSPPAPGPSPDRSQWERIALSPDIELHIRRPLGRDQNRRVDRLVTIARQLLEEDPS